MNMKHQFAVEIVGRPEFYFELVKKDVDCLIRLAEKHYDGACQAAAKGAMHGEGRTRNGLLIMWRNQWYGENTNTPQRISATWRDLDLVLKITEILHTNGGTDEENEVASRLHFAFRRAMTHFNESLAPKWKEIFDAGPRV